MTTLGVEKSELNAVNRIPDYLSDFTDRAKVRISFRSVVKGIKDRYELTILCSSHS